MPFFEALYLFVYVQYHHFDTNSMLVEDQPLEDARHGEIENRKLIHLV